MNKTIATALEHDQLVDITTMGRKTGQPHRIEIRYCRKRVSATQRGRHGALAVC